MDAIHRYSTVCGWGFCDVAAASQSPHESKLEATGRQARQAVKLSQLIIPPPGLICRAANHVPASLLKEEGVVRIQSRDRTDVDMASTYIYDRDAE